MKNNYFSNIHYEITKILNLSEEMELVVSLLKDSAKNQYFVEIVERYKDDQMPNAHLIWNLEIFQSIFIAQQKIMQFIQEHEKS